MIAASIALTLIPIAAGDAAWSFSPDLAERGFATRAGTPSLQVAGTLAFGADGRGGGLILDGTTTELTITERGADLPSALPARAFTVGAWVSIDRPLRWGGIIGCVRDDGDLEKGWVLGYDEQRFTIALSTEGADDGNGHLTYLAAGEHTYDIGRWHHVAATYDGHACHLFVDGELRATTHAQSGALLYDLEAPFVIGAYRDTNEHHRHDGRLRFVRLVDHAMTPAEIRSWAAEPAGLGQLPPWVDTTLAWLVDPFLTWPTHEAMSVTFETTVPTDATLECWHETGSERRIERSSRSAQLHHVRLQGLRPNEKYFYRVSVRDFRGETLQYDDRSFRTAVTDDRSFTFVAIGDTQSQADVAKRVSDLAYMHRPNLAVHAGDLVDTGTVKSDWTGHFFPAMQPLISRVPLMPVLGNHEQDAPHYYDYMDLPEPESYYAFTFGNAEFFMIDGNRKLAPGSAQLAWLDHALAASTATWKFAVLHQPPYTSDSNDYGDTHETVSQRGDPNVQNIITLLERAGVDICFSGHVHDYERTFPIRGGRVTPYEEGGVVYVTTAGGGGHLEDFDPTNTWFGHKKTRSHHLVYVAVFGDHLEFQAIDQHGRLFDVFELRKTEGRRERVGG
ncbi:MAG: metallophosphoesterase [Phycisphaerales bacterium]|nr:metallophosphoesterase [Phycisphaerae bacterium]NNM25877.1 metallophosphoesterase [Phycisphaerales bacterium]